MVCFATETGLTLRNSQWLWTGLTAKRSRPSVSDWPKGRARPEKEKESSPDEQNLDFDRLDEFFNWVLKEAGPGTI